MSDLLVIFILFGLPVLGVVALGMAWLRHSQAKAEIALEMVQAQARLSEAEAARAQAEARKVEAQRLRLVP